MNASLKLLAIGLLLGAVSGCATTLPSYSHVHVGHALTGWFNTPNQKGLFVTAEDFARQVAIKSSGAADYSRAGDIDSANSLGSEVADLIGTLDKVADPDDYRFLNSFQEARSHLSFAKESDDASVSMQEGVSKFQADSEIVIARAELIKILGSDLSITKDQQTAEDISREMKILAVQNLEGEDINNSGFIGDSPDEFGLRQLRDDLAETLKREVPAYRPVEQRYLFGIVRLPDGTWKFRDSGSTGSYTRGGGY